MVYIEDFLPSGYRDYLESTMVGESATFPWYYNNRTAGLDRYAGAVIGDEYTRESKQFTHTFFNDGMSASNLYSVVSPFLVLLEKEFNCEFSNRVNRIKANLMIKDTSFPEGFYNPAHIDELGCTQTAIYYVNDSDGETVLFDQYFGTNEPLTVKRRITPKKGSLLLFDAMRMHASTPPRESSERVVINFVFK